jgi:type I restriction enzyme S subunit
MSFPRYEAYKDSGVEWLGEIPKHWEVWKLAHAFDVIGSGTTPKTDNPAYLRMVRSPG